MDTTPMPKWFTPERKAYLVRLFLKCGGFCVYGHRPCPNPEHHYQVYIEGLIRQWASDNRARDSAQWQAERRILHATAERTEPLRGRFSGVSRDIWHYEQPQHYIEALGMSGVVLTPFAKVRLASNFMRLHVDLADSLRGASKNQRRKAIRYGKPLPKTIEDRINRAVSLAVRDYLNH